MLGKSNVRTMNGDTAKKCRDRVPRIFLLVPPLFLQGAFLVAFAVMHKISPGRGLPASGSGVLRPKIVSTFL